MFAFAHVELLSFMIMVMGMIFEPSAWEGVPL
jgi:hypothetical protein